MTKPRSDPLHLKFFAPIGKVEFWSDVFFYVGVVLSLASAFVDSKTQPDLHQFVFIAFAVDVVALLVASLVSRVYFSPRAQDARFNEFLSCGYQVRLTADQTSNYYNNNARTPVRRIAAQLFENALFSKSIALRMAQTERARVGLYFLVWLLVVLHRRTDFGVIAAASQAVFSEQIISRWVRLEWVRNQFETAYERMFTLFQTNPPSPKFDALAISAVGSYESAKASASIALSNKVFLELNTSLSAEWERVKVATGVDS